MQGTISRLLNVNQSYYLSSYGVIHFYNIFISNSIINMSRNNGFLKCPTTVSVYDAVPCPLLIIIRIQFT